MALFTADHLFRYSHRNIGEANHLRSAKILSKRHGENIFDFLGISWIETAAKLEKSVSIMKKLKLQNQDLREGDLKFVWQRFLKKSGCIHCHDGQGRAAENFIASSEGLVEYIKNNSGIGFLNLLKTRKIEHELNLISFPNPGMPLAGPPVVEKDIKTIERWVVNHCPDQKMRYLCKRH